MTAATVVAVVRGRGSIWPSTETMSGCDGRFGYCAVSPAKVTISIRYPAYRPRKQWVNTGAFDYSTGQLEITLRKR